jgi:hypothetical protein
MPFLIWGSNLWISHESRKAVQFQNDKPASKMEIAKSTLSYLQITKPGNSTATTAYLSRLVDSSSLSETVRARANMIPWLGVTINSLQQIHRLLKVHKHEMFLSIFCTSTHRARRASITKFM